MRCSPVSQVLVDYPLVDLRRVGDIIGLAVFLLSGYTATYYMVIILIALGIYCKVGLLVMSDDKILVR